MKPRLFGIPATRSPVVAILRRGPSDWSQVNRWDPEAGTFEHGSWIHANLYPQRCDLSPDGRWFSYFTLRQKAEWTAGPTYIAISRLPWLTALAAWGTCGTWTCGLHFVEHRRTWEVGPPAEGDIEPLRERYGFGLELTRPPVFAVERRRGWTETADSPPYDAEQDLWDIRRTPRLTMEKPRPGADGSDPTDRRRLVRRLPVGPAVVVGGAIRDRSRRGPPATRGRPVGRLGPIGAPAGGDDRRMPGSARSTMGLDRGSPGPSIWAMTVPNPQNRPRSRVAGSNRCRLQRPLAGGP